MKKCMFRFGNLFACSLLCKKCGKIYDLPFSGETKQVERIDMNGFFIEEIHQYYKGVCPACAAKEQGKEVG